MHDAGVKIILSDTIFFIVPPVTYDEDGCYDPKEYMAFVNKGDKFQSFSDLLGKSYY